MVTLAWIRGATAGSTVLCSVQKNDKVGPNPEVSKRNEVTLLIKLASPQSSLIQFILLTYSTIRNLVLVFHPCQTQWEWITTPNAWKETKLHFTLSYVFIICGFHQSFNKAMFSYYSPKITFYEYLGEEPRNYDQNKYSIIFRVISSNNDRKSLGKGKNRYQMLFCKRSFDRSSILPSSYNGLCWLGLCATRYVAL